MIYFFLSQSAMLFSDHRQSLVTSVVSETETDVRIINEVDAARMARFPVNLTPNVGHPGGRREGNAHTELNMYIA